MDAIIVYMLLINSGVAVIALVIAVAQQRFHRRVEDKLTKAIEDTKDSVQTQLGSVTTEVESHIEQRMWQMEKRFYEKMEDPATYGKFIKKLTDHLHVRFMNESRGITKKIEGFKDEVRQVAQNGGDFTDLAAMQWDDEAGLFTNLIKNTPLIAKQLKRPNGPASESSDASLSEAGPPSWWDEEDQKAMEQLIMEREELHKVNIEP